MKSRLIPLLALLAGTSLADIAPVPWPWSRPSPRPPVEKPTPDDPAPDTPSPDTPAPSDTSPDTPAEPDCP